METPAMKDEKAMHPRDTEWPKSCREKFVWAWNEKLRLQQRPILSQLPGSPAAIGIPSQEKWTKDKMPPSHFLQRASLEPSENAIYFLAVAPASQGQQPSSSERFWTTGHCSQQLPTASWQRELDLIDKEVDWETNAEEELVQICVSDLLLESPLRRRPRLLPPNRKMHMEVWKKQALQHPLQRCARSLPPMECNHLEETVAMTNSATLPKVESFYRSFTQGSCRASSVLPLAERLSPARGTEASTDQQAGGETTEMMHKQPQHLSLEGSAPLSDLIMATKLPMSSLPYSHLPPKKRYTQYYL